MHFLKEPLTQDVEPHKGGVHRLSTGGGQAETITVDGVLDIIRAGRMRLRAFGETQILGADAIYNGDFVQAAAGARHALETGTFRVYRDHDGLFIGPSAPSLIERNPFIEGGALQ